MRPSASLAAALLSDSPAARLLARTQRQIAAFERTWYRANTELRRARRQSEAANDQNFLAYLGHLCAPSPAELASLHPANRDIPDTPATAASPKNWPPTDEKTGKPLYFVG